MPELVEFLLNRFKEIKEDCEISEHTDFWIHISVEIPLINVNL
jgi:hypothetical protein